MAAKQCKYIEHIHSNTLEVLKNSLETEMWQVGIPEIKSIMEMLYRIRLYCCIVVAKSFGSPLWIEDCHSYLLWKCVAPGLSLVDSTHHGHYCSEREIFANVGPISGIHK